MRKKLNLFEKFRTFWKKTLNVTFSNAVLLYTYLIVYFKYKLN